MEDYKEEFLSSMNDVVSKALENLKLLGMDNKEARWAIGWWIREYIGQPRI